MTDKNGFLTYSEAMEILKAGGMVALADWRRFEYITLEKGKLDPDELLLTGLFNGFPRELFEASTDGSYSYPSLKHHDKYSITSTYQPSNTDMLRARWAQITAADLDVPLRSDKVLLWRDNELWGSVI